MEDKAKLVGGGGRAVYVWADDLRAFTVRVLAAAGMGPTEAGIVADHLIEADLRGVHSHGVLRLLVYPRRLRAGIVAPRSTITVVRETPATLVVDGGNGMGHVVGYRAMELCIVKARQSGAAWAGVRNSNHFGMAGYFAMQALPYDYIGLAMTVGGVNIMAPWGGIDRLLGNNPIAFAIPAGRERPIVLDMAVSVVAKGWISMAVESGATSIPAGWALTKDGEPTTDPNEANEGLVAPMGGYKGANLAIVIGILAGILPGATFGKAVREISGEGGPPPNIGHLFGAIAVESFMDPVGFKALVDVAIQELKGSRRATGVETILMPGEAEYLKAEEYRDSGVPVDVAIHEKLQALAAEFGVEGLPKPERWRA